VILAGGSATRMGTDKAMVEFCGKPMIEHVATALAAAGLEMLVVGRAQAPGDLPAIVDIADLGGGPAVGLLTAFRHLPDSDVLLVAVDQPQVRSATVVEILQQPGDAVVPIASGHPQVTCALYRREAHDAIERAVSAGQMKLRRMLDDVDTNYVDEPTWAGWGEDGRSWMSLDTPQAVRDAEAPR
jgi:molybdopterin-guanine dinucleotide biosynthesis protein A